MKYQPRHTVLDPDVRPPEWAFDDDKSDAEDAPGDAYVIGSDGEIVSEPEVADPLGALDTRPRPWLKPAAALLGVAFVLLTIWNLSRAVQGPPPPPPLSEFQVKQALYLGVMKVDAYRRAHGVTPDTLSDLDLPTASYAYTRTDSKSYVLSFQANGTKMEYDSHQPKEDVFGKPQEILSMGDSK